MKVPEENLKDMQAMITHILENGLSKKNKQLKVIK